MKIVLSDSVADQTAGNYVERIIYKEWEVDNDSTVLEYDDPQYFPTYSDLPEDIRIWLEENNISAVLIFEERAPLMLNFDFDDHALLYQLRWG